MVQIGESMATGGGDGPSPAPVDESDGPAARVRFVEILGLYRAGFDDGLRRNDGSRYRCGYQAGYTSADDRGRVFVNHRPRPDASAPWEPARAKDVQYVEITAEVVTSGPVPSGIEVEWTVEDPDDPSDASMHAAGARHIDPNRGRGGDNQGSCDFPRAAASRSPTFEAVSGFAMSGSGSTRRTALQGSRTKVRVHLTNVGGDNFRITGRVVGASGPAVVVSTGLITMWKRLDVEYHQMTGVHTVPVAAVAQAFEPAFVQLDFTAPVTAAHRPALSRTRNLEGPARRWANRVFRHRRRPGWFMLGAADLETSLVSSSPPRTFYTGAGTLHAFPGEQWVAIPRRLLDSRGAALTAGSVKLRNGSDTLTFWADGQADNWPAPGHTGILLRPIRYYNVIDPRDGSSAHAHTRPNDYLPMPQAGTQSLGFSSSVTCDVQVGFAIGASGITPRNRHRRRLYMVGRTIVFMGRFTSAAQSVQTIVHELCHAFGFAHSCGRTAAAASSRHACTMAILDHWVFRPGTGALQRWHHPPRHTDFCEYHLRGLRQTHLEDNPALWRWP